MAGVWQRVRGWLDRERVVQVLWVVHVVLAVGAFFALKHDRSGDHQTYLNLGIGLLQGRYSFWYFLDPYPADTFRTPGYPLFVGLTSLAGHAVILTQIVQVGLHLGSVLLGTRLVRKLAGDAPLARALFLLLLVPNAQLLYYIARIFPETLMIFLVTLYFTWEVDDPADNLWAHARIGLLLGIAALVRPVAMLVPFVRFAFALRSDHRKARLLGAGIGVVVTYLCLTPYALWNERMHHKLSFTPIEGSAPNREMGFWQLRLPNQPTERFWHGNWMGHEIVPFIDPADLPRYVAEYHAQWDRIDAAAAPFLTDADRARLPTMREKRWLFLTYDTPYTLARSKAVEKEYQARIREAPGYYLMTRAYTAVRLWITGVNLAGLHQPGVKSKLVALYPTVVSFLSFGLGLPFAAWSIARRNAARVSTLPFWLFGFVYWGAHVPMSIQSRYTVPMHVGALVLLATALARALAASPDEARPEAAPLTEGGAGTA